MKAYATGVSRTRKSDSPAVGASPRAASLATSPSTVLSCMPRSRGRYGADEPSRRGPCADRPYTVGRGDATVKRRLLSVSPDHRRRVRKLSSNDREARRVLTAMKTLLAALIGLAIAAFASPANGVRRPDRHVDPGGESRRRR